MSSIPRDAFLLIIGAQKSGTSSLYNYLVQHPQICKCGLKEPEYFSIRKTNIKKYENLWRYDQTLHKYVIEASTGSTCYPQYKDVPKKIFEYGLYPKFIYIVRDPYQRILSQLYYLDILDNVGKENERQLEKGIERSMYYTQLSQFRKYFAQDRILVLDFDDLRYNQIQLISKVYDFLSLDYIPPTKNMSARNVTIKPFAQQVRNSVVFRRIFNVLPISMKNITRDIFVSVFKEEKVDMPPEKRKYIYDRLRDDMRKFGEE